MKDTTAVKYFLLTFVITWGAWGLLILMGTALDPSSPSYLLFMLGGFGPSLAGLVLTAIFQGRSGLIGLWQRTLRLGFGFR